MALDHIHGIFDSFSKLFTEQRELAAIWLERPLITARGKSIRIAPDELVAVKNGCLVDCLDKPTHKVIACFGTLNSQFEMTLIDLITSEPMQIKL